jgi:hypothetical protein
MGHSWCGLKCVMRSRFSSSRICRRIRAERVRCVDCTLPPTPVMVEDLVPLLPPFALPRADWRAAPPPSPSPATTIRQVLPQSRPFLIYPSLPAARNWVPQNPKPSPNPNVCYLYSDLTKSQVHACIYHLTLISWFLQKGNFDFFSENCQCVYPCFSAPACFACHMFSVLIGCWFSEWTEARKGCWIGSSFLAAKQ